MSRLGSPRSANPLDRLSPSAVVDEYRRRGLDDLDDRRLVAAAAALIGVPRAEVIGDRYSFVLHAPLELLARSALLSYVAPEARECARLRIVALAAEYEASGPALQDPAPAQGRFGSLGEAAGALAGAVGEEDLDAVDIAAAWIGERARPDEIAAHLADTAIDRLSAAGHGNIYLALLARTQPRGLPMQMLRHPARELAKGAGHRIAVPPTRVAPGAPAGVDALLDALTQAPVIGPPPVPFIAPLVERAQQAGVFNVLVGADGVFSAPPGPPFELLRFAAHAMLQGSSDHVPYGWTHCLTLAQAPLLLGPAGSDRAGAVFVAAAYLAAHWAGLGAGVVDLSYAPDAPETASRRHLEAALDDGPSAAAAAAWYEPDREATIATLATSASLAHDAHRVKYALACLDAAASDPTHTPLYLAACASLESWWRQHPDLSDPFADQLAIA